MLVLEFWSQKNNNTGITHHHIIKIYQLFARANSFTRLFRHQTFITLLITVEISKNSYICLHTRKYDLLTIFFSTIYKQMLYLDTCLIISNLLYAYWISLLFTICLSLLEYLNIYFHSILYKHIISRIIIWYYVLDYNDVVLQQNFHINTSILIFYIEYCF